MKRLLLLVAGLLAIATPAFAQFTTVTATVKDPNGIPYAGAVMNAVLVPSTGGGYTLGGQPYSGRIGPVTLSSSGSFTVNFGDVTQITPGSPQWQITIDSAAATIALPLGTGPQTFVYTSTGTTISGSSPVSLSTALNALAPALTNITLGPGSVTSVSCGNLTNVFNCSVATPTTTPVLSFAAVTSGPVLDCSVQAGADMGAQLNACIAALPASGGIADATKFTSPQTISTAVVDNKAAVIQTCGIAITQTANISFTAVNAAWHGCQDQGTVITKGANIDQMTVSANTVKIDYVTLKGVSASFTGNGIVIGTSQNVDVENNTVTNEASDAIQLTGNSFYGNISQNELSGYVAHAIHENGASAGFGYWFQHNDIQDTATATGSAVELTQQGWVTENQISNLHGFLTIHNTQSTTNASVYSGNFLQSIGTGGQVISVAGQDYIHHNTMYNVGANAIIVGGASITDNNLQKTTAGGDVIDAPSSLVPIIKGNNIQFLVASVAGNCSININGAAGWEGGYVANNRIGYNGTGSGANYGVCLTTTAGQFADDMVVENNYCVSSTGGGTGSACVFFNNTAGVTTNGSSNVVRTNQCIGINICIARTDAQNLQNYYENNATGLATTLFGAGGSTNDVIIQQLGVNGAGITFATLPTAGNGSQIYISDATCTGPAAAGGSGCLLFRVNGVWTGNQAMAGTASTTPVTASNPTINTDTQLIQLSVPVKYFNALANSYSLELAGNYTTTAASSPALTYKVQLCTVSGCGSGTVVTLINIVTTALSATALSNATWTLNVTCVTNATGTTGNLVCKGTPGLTLDTGASIVTPDSTFADTNTATSSNIDLTAALFLRTTVAQSVAGGSNSYVQTLAALR